MSGAPNVTGSDRMALNIETFSNVTGGNAFYKAHSYATIRQFGCTTQEVLMVDQLTLQAVCQMG